MRTPQVLAKLLEPVLRRIAMLVATGEVTAVNDATKMQQLQATLLSGETADAINRPQPYGLTSAPAVGAPLVVVCVGGDRGHPLALAVDDPRYRPQNLAAGEVALYSKHGQRFHLKSNGNIEITGDAQLTAHAKDEVDIESDQKITLHVGASKIEIEDTGITITTPTGVATFT